jgi:phosphatidate cytidylyltransferase
MLRTRTLVGIVGLPIIVTVVMIGGFLFEGALTLLLALGVWELARFSRAEGFQPVRWVALILLAVLLVAVHEPAVQGPGIAAVILLAMLVMLLDYERGGQTPLNNYALTLGSGLTLGWLGAYLIRLRLLTDGAWWLLLILMITFAVDSGAYLIGKPFGRHKLAPRVSPKKSWEGYAGGVLFGVLFGGLFGLLWHARVPAIGLPDGVLLGVLIALITPVGDLAISAFKRQADLKNSSDLIPGHGGILDRLDTVLVAAVLGYYYILWMVG